MGMHNNSLFRASQPGVSFLFLGTVGTLTRVGLNLKDLLMSYLTN